MLTNDDILTALSDVIGPDGKTPLSEAGASVRNLHSRREGFRRHHRRSGSQRGA